MPIGELIPRALSSASDLELCSVLELIRDGADRGPQALGCRVDRARTAMEFVAAVTRLPDGRFTLADLDPSVPGPQGKRLRRIVDPGAAWDPVPLRRTLVDLAAPDAQVLVIEREELEGAKKRRIDAFSITALGADMAVPVGWKLLEVTEGEAAADLGELEWRAVRELVIDFEADLRAVGHPAGSRPFMAVDSRDFGESAAVRQALASIGCEHLLEIGGDFDELKVERYGFASAVPEEIASRQLATAGTSAVAILSGGECSGSYLTSFDSGIRRYAIARPTLERGPGALTGNRGATRARELAELAESIVMPGMAAQLRMTDFGCPHVDGYERFAFLASALKAVITGAMPAEGLAA